MTASQTSSATAVLGQLLRSPGGDSKDAERRLALVQRLLRKGGGWWTAEELAEEGEAEELRAQLKELRRIGVLGWDQQIGGYSLVEELRVPLSLALMACQGPPDQDQLMALDRLLPYAQLASRGDEVAAPAWAMLDLLARDVRMLQSARMSGPEKLAEVARERWLVRSSESMNLVLDHLKELAQQNPAAETLVEQAVELLSEAGELIAGLSLRMSRSARDNLRLAGTQRSASQLRSSLAELSAEQLSDAVALYAGLAPSVTSVPSAEQLAGAWPSFQEVQERSYPAPKQGQMPAPEPKRTDARELARVRLLGRRVFSDADRWSEAVRVHQGLVRLQGEAARSGEGSWQSVAEREIVGGEVSWAWKIISA